MRGNTEKESKIIKNIAIAGALCVGVLVIIISSILFFKVRSNNDISSEEITGKIEDSADNYESASTEIGKTIEDAKNEQNIVINENNVSQNENKVDSSENKSNDKTADTASTIEKHENKENKEEPQEEKKQEEKEITFSAPVKGEILREFASDSLVYSETLQEWITHKGIDIKADKTTVVTSACEGTIQSIKNDPRYGLTVIINHDGGYQTIYSNLLTAEFVVEGEKVTKGQTIGTVGNTASFEINDGYHLHFELLKNNEYVDPTIYMVFE